MSTTSLLSWLNEVEVRTLPPRAFKLLLELFVLCAARLTDGRFDAQDVPALGGKPADLSELIRRGLVIAVVDRFTIRDYLDHCPSLAQVEAERDRDRTRKRLSRACPAGTEGGTDTGTEHGTQGGTEGGTAQAPSPLPSLLSNPGSNSSLVPENSPALSSSSEDCSGSARDSEIRAKQPRRARKIPLPDAWKPNAAHTMKAIQLGLDLHGEVERFRNNALGKDVRWVDWDRAFHNWLNSPFAAPQRVNGKAPGLADHEGQRIEANTRHEHRKWLKEQAESGLFGPRAKDDAEAGTLNLDKLEAWHRRQGKHAQAG